MYNIYIFLYLAGLGKPVLPFVLKKITNGRGFYHNIAYTACKAIISQRFCSAKYVNNS